MKLLLIYIGFCVLGGILGAKLKKKKKDISWSGKVQMALLIILLVTMGMRLGVNKEVLASIRDIGISAFLITICCMAGSVAMIFLVRKMMKINKKGVSANE